MWSAIFIVRLTHAAKGRSAAHLSAATLACTSVACWLLTAAYAQSGRLLASEVVKMVHEHGMALLYLSIVVSAGSSFLQATGQQSVPPHEAAVIYTLDPVRDWPGAHSQTHAPSHVVHRAY